MPRLSPIQALPALATRALPVFLALITLSPSVWAQNTPVSAQDDQVTGERVPQGNADENPDKRQNVPAPVLSGVDSTLKFEPKWTVRVEPAVAYFGLSGDITMPAETSGSEGLKVTLQSLNMDSPRLAPAGELHLAKGPYRLTFTGFGLSIDRSTEATFAGRIGDAPVALGDVVTSDISYSTFAMLGSYRVWSRGMDLDDNGYAAVGAAIDVVGGIRFHSVDTSIDITPTITPGPGVATSSAVEQFFAEPVVGARLDLLFTREFGIDFYTLFGGMPASGHGSSSFDLGVGFVYRPTTSVGFQIGYRLLIFSLEDGEGPEEFKWSGAVAGLYWGLQLSF